MAAKQKISRCRGALAVFALGKTEFTFGHPAIFIAKHEI
jgi:hypothetical protein